MNKIAYKLPKTRMIGLLDSEKVDARFNFFDTKIVRYVLNI